MISRQVSSKFLKPEFDSFASRDLNYLEIRPDRVFLLHGLVIFVLVLAHLAVSWLHIQSGRDHLLGLTSRLQFLTESSIPAFFSAVMLVAAAAIAALLARVDAARDARIWTFITLLLLYMAVDEATSIHEVFNNLGDRQAEDGALFYVWVVPFGALALICAGILLPFWWRLPPGTKWWLAGAAALFITSAIGMELPESVVVAQYGEEAAFMRWDFIAMVTVEEAGEMLAVAMAIRALLHHLASLRGDSATLRVSLP